MSVEAALHRHQGGEEPDRAGAGDEGMARLPGSAVADSIDLLPGLGDDAGWLKKDTQDAEGGIDLDRELGLEAKPLRAIAVALLDAAFGVEAVAAHIPFALAAAEAGNGIGPADDADDEIADAEAATGWCRL